MGANERSKLILDPHTHGSSRWKSRLSAPMKASDVYAPRTPAGAGHGRGSWWSGTHRWASAGACAAPFALCALLILGHVYGGHVMRHSGVDSASATATATVGVDEGRAASSGRWSTWTRGRDASEANDDSGESPAYAGGESTSHAVTAFDAGRTTGVALHGWLNLEEWFFSQGASHAVVADEREANGVCFPPMYPDAHALGFSWASEGDLVNKLVRAVGAKATVHSFNAHRAQYVTDEDLLEIASKGIELVRLPVSWSLFARDPASVPRGGERILVDPVYPDRLFVNMAGADLDAVVERIRNAGLKVLIDLHSMPGGAAKGTFNGVFPHPPMMFARKELRSTGLAIVRNFLGWFKNLPAESRAAVHGLQLLNEPGHMLPEQRTQVLDWLTNAVDIYRQELVNEGLSASERVPFLYINLVETLGLNVADMAAWMRSQFTPRELKDWAVLDVHHYFAWSYTGCMGGSNAGCAFDCNEKPSVVAQRIGELSGEWAGSLRAAAQTYGVQNLAVSEWSLATFSDSSKSCSNRAMLDIMYEHQEQAYRGAGIQGFFWGWKMPHGGSHAKAWSLSDYLSQGERKEMHHKIVPHGYELDAVSETLSEGSTKADAERLIRAYGQFADEPAPTTGGANVSETTMPVSDVLKLLNAARESASIGDREVHFPSVNVAPVVDSSEFKRATSELEKIIDVDEYAEDEEDATHEVFETPAPPKVVEQVDPVKPADEVPAPVEEKAPVKTAKKTEKPKSNKKKDESRHAERHADPSESVEAMLADIPLTNSHVDVLAV